MSEMLPMMLIVMQDGTLAMEQITEFRKHHSEISGELEANQLALYFVESEEFLHPQMKRYLDANNSLYVMGIYNGRHLGWWIYHRCNQHDV